MKQPPLYPHQRKAIGEIKKVIAKRGARVVLSCPTAGGKTRIAAELIRAMLKEGRRVTFTAPKLEIINQTVDRLIEAGVPSSKIGVIQAQHARTDGTRPVQVASVQTLAQRDFPPNCDLVIVDECHEQFRVIKRWMARPKSPNFVGLSATPWARGMADDWTDGVIEAGDTQSLIDAGVLCDFRVFLRERYDTRALHIRNGDYVPGELNEAAKDSRVTADIIKSWKKHGQARPTVAFCVSREHAESLTKRFTAAKISAAYMDGDTPEKVRADIRARFHAGKIKVICNVGVLTTGADWNIGCIILARPTQSKILFVQVIGRGLRNPPGKTDCLILDHTNNHELHGRVTDIAAEGLRGIEVKDNDYFKKRCPAVTQCEACGGDVPASTLKCPHCDEAMPRSVLIEREHVRMVELDESLRGRLIQKRGARAWKRDGLWVALGSTRTVTDEQHDTWCRRLNEQRYNAAALMAEIASIRAELNSIGRRSCGEGRTPGQWISKDGKRYWSHKKVVLNLGNAQKVNERQHIDWSNRLNAACAEGRLESEIAAIRAERGIITKNRAPADPLKGKFISKEGHRLWLAPGRHLGQKAVHLGSVRTVSEQEHDALCRKLNAAKDDKRQLEAVIQEARSRVRELIESKRRRENLRRDMTGRFRPHEH